MGPGTPRAPGRFACVALTAIVLGLLTVPMPGFVGAPRTAVSPQPGPPRPTAMASLGVSSPTPIANLPGSDPSGEPFISAPQLALAELAAMRAASVKAAPSESGAIPASVGARSVPLPARPSTANGTVTGTIVDRQTSVPVANASVTLFLVTGGCNGFVCPTATTGTSGTFSISAPPTTYLLTVVAAHFATNDTTVTVLSTTTTSLGTIYLQEDALVTGTIRGSDPTHEPVDNASVIAYTRNYAVTGAQGFTSANGSFEIEAPPGADVIHFGPSSSAPYEANLTDVETRPGQTTPLGTLYLLAGTAVNVTFVDRVTHQPILSGFVSKDFTCSARTGACPLDASGGEGPNVTVYAIPGPTVLHALVVGYSVNVTSIGVVPEEPFGTSVHRIVNLTPLGVIRLTDGVTGGTPSKGGTNITYWEWWIAIAPYVSNISGLDVCSLDGEDVAINTSMGIVSDPCFPNILGAFGGVEYALGPPLRDWIGSGSFEGSAPMFQNETWVNLTPDRVTSIGDLNFTAGAYLSGQVYVTGTTRAPSSFTVQACSRDESEICGPPTRFPWTGEALLNGTRTYDLDGANVSLVGCPTGSADFCIAAPPGPVEIRAFGGSNLTANFTWANVPSECCLAPPRALALANVTPEHVRSINLTPNQGVVYGRYLAGPGSFTTPIDTLLVNICPVLSTGGSCTEGYGTAGTFSLPAPLGWDQLTFTAPGYLSNETWINVTGTNSAGTIVLTPMASISGTVVSSNGTGILGAVLQDCPLSAVAPTQTGCQLLPAPTTGTSGQFVGQLSAGPYPGSTFALSASASGFLTNFTWLNTTPGNLIDLPPIVLTPVGSEGNGPPSLARPPSVRPSGTPGTWVDGRLADGGTGLGIESAFLTACTFSGSTCISFTDPTGSDGQFNESLPLGTYYLTTYVPGYAVGDFYANATGTAPVHLGTLDLTPYPWVSGRVAIAPWVTGSLAEGLGPGIASVQVCTSSRSECGLGGVVNGAGSFNVTAPPGTNDGLVVNGTGGSGYDSPTEMASEGGAAEGFVSNLTPVTIGASDVRLNSSPATVPVLEIDSSVQGTVWDGTSPRTGPGNPTVPARWSSVTLEGPAPKAYVTLLTSGDGAYTAFLPGSETLRINATGTAFLGSNATARVPASGGAGSAPPISLPHFGWITAKLRSTSGAPVPFASIAVVQPDPANATVISVGGESNGGGDANVTAPPGATDGVNITAAGFVGQNTTVTLRPSETVPLQLARFTPASTIEYVRSRSVNVVGVAPDPTLVDPSAGVPIDGASIALSTPSSGIYGETISNGLGQFLVAGDPATVSTLTVARTGYATVTLPVPTPVNGEVVYPRINLTGDGILAGRVVAAPGTTPTPGVNVTACEVFPNGGCLTVVSNGAGIFWAEVPPGDYAINLSADGYTPAATYGAQSTSDGWTWIGNLSVLPDGSVVGRVVGSPFDLPIQGANVTLCPANGSASGFSVYCAFSTPTDFTGGFTIPSPPGIYYVNVSAPRYGPWSLEIELAPGEQYDLGEIALAPDGALIGRVIDAQSGGSIGGADVTACTSDTSRCVGPVLTNASGAYAIGPLDPGPAAVEASATGYTSSQVAVTIPAGGTLVAAPIALYPVGSQPMYPVSGVVVWNGTGQGIAGATVTATSRGGGIGAATVSGPNGAFGLSLASGPYGLRATAPGAEPGSLLISVDNASVSNLRIGLAPQTYPVAGTVRAVGSGAPIPGVEVSAGAAGANQTDSAGRYRLDLPNGSYEITASPRSGPVGLEFNPVTIGVTINGAGATLNVTLPEKGETLQILAVDAATGLGVAGAAGRVLGTSRFGTAVLEAVAADAGGTIGLSLPLGNYTIYLNASGYDEGKVRFTVNATSPPVVVAMNPSGGSTPSGATLTSLDLEWLSAGAIGAVAVGIFLGQRRRGPPSPSPSPGEASETGDPGGGSEPPALLPPE